MTLKINDGGIDRDMTASELAEYEETVKGAEAQAAAQAAAADAKAAAIASAKAKLAALGLTDDEIAALVGA